MKTGSRQMKIAYYMPFKPLGHNNPSGDLIIGTELFHFLRKSGADIRAVSRLRCRWIYLKPYLWPVLFVEIFRILRRCGKEKPDIWLTYHSYYKAPDVLGPLCCRLLDIPYVVFQGIYSTKRRRSLKTWAGFHLNRRALLQAACVITNKKKDKANLKRLLTEDRILYIPPGLHPHEFHFEEHSRREIRGRLRAQGRVVVMTAAMFRPGVKTAGICKVIKSCRILVARGGNILLLVAGDGKERALLEKKAEAELGDDAVFLGKLSRETMRKYYSAADIFAFPGIEESLGMVFLEAQACGLPVVAYRDWGAGEAVLDGQTGLLSPAAEEDMFTDNLQKLADDTKLRRTMGEAAAIHIGDRHDIDTNYTTIYRRLEEIVTRACAE
jgi:glycosyltransferase involved in cell wall biosynthesis